VDNNITSINNKHRIAELNNEVNEPTVQMEDKISIFTVCTWNDFGFVTAFSPAR